MPASDCGRVSEQIEDVIGIDASEALEVSAKSGLGIQETLEAIVKKLPHPKGERNSPLKAMLVDSWYDAYLGVVVLVRIMDGVLEKGDKIKMFSNGSVHTVDRIGVFRPEMQSTEQLGPGEIGFITASIKQVRILGSVIQLPTRKREQKNLCQDLILANQLFFVAYFQ